LIKNKISSEEGPDTIIRLSRKPRLSWGKALVQKRHSFRGLWWKSGLVLWEIIERE